MQSILLKKKNVVSENWQKTKKIITVTAVRPPARFGEIKLKKNLVLIKSIFQKLIQI